MIRDYVKFAIDGILHRKLRSWLTMVGIFIGIIAVVALISLGQGLQAFINEQFEKVGGNRIIISPGGGGFGETSNPLFSAAYVTAKLRESDLNIIKKFKEVEFAAGALVQSAKVEFNGKNKYLLSMNYPNDAKTTDFIKTIDFFEIEKGKYLQQSDKYKVAIAHDIAYGNYFGKNIHIGDKILIEGKEFLVVGIYKKSGNPLHDSKIAMPLETAKELFNVGDEYSSIFVTVKKEFSPKSVAEKIKKKLRRHRDVKEGEEDFSVATSEQLIESFQTVLNLVQIVLIGIAAISLIVGGIGIMNTMYTSVLERTKQIGIMKAVGARNSNVLFIFLIESGMLGLVGGFIGVILGMLLSYSVEFILRMNGIDFLKIYISLELILGTLLFSFFVGCISGLMPARRAALMNPVDALRYR